MRIILLVLLLAVCVNGGDFFDTELGAKIKSIVEKIKTRLNVTALLEIRKKFLDMREKTKASLALSPQAEKNLQKLMTEVKDIKKDHVHKGGESIEEINQKVGMADLLFQGDIVLTNAQADEMISDMEEEENGSSNRTKRQTFKDHNYPKTIWSEGVNYKFHPTATASMRSVFKKSADNWSKSTCIDFHEDIAGLKKELVTVFYEKGCWSYVGNLHRHQQLSLGRGCDTIATAQHEIGHALGFFHTHSRLDRDDFIIFNAQNVVPQYLDQFKKQNKHTNDNYGLTYDYGSIMHYGASSGSFNGKPTMVSKDAKYVETLGSPFIGFYDLLMINKHYGCLDKCGEDSAKCAMGGFPNPRDCSKCVCPSGYGGDLCDQKPEGCGEVLEATKEAKTLKAEIGDRNAGDKDREDMSMCYYWLKAPEGSKIEVKIVKLAEGLTIDGCRMWGVEIKTHEDQRLSGYRFCAPEDAGVTLVSNSNIVPIIAFNRHSATEFELEYRVV